MPARLTWTTGIPGEIFARVLDSRDCARGIDPDRTHRGGLPAGLTSAWTKLARDMGWSDGSYVRRQLGRRAGPSTLSRGVRYPGALQEFVSPEQADRIALAMDLGWWEVERMTADYARECFVGELSAVAS